MDASQAGFIKSPGVRDRFGGVASAAVARLKAL
jgi:hypothetical protein